MKRILVLACLFLFVLFYHDISVSEVAAAQQVDFPKSYVELHGTTDSNLLVFLKKYDTIVITKGNGGLVYGMLETLKYLNSNPRKRIIIDGNCYSACTMLLSATHSVRITPRARFHFHSSVSDVCVYGELQKQISRKGNRDMLRVFGITTRAWIVASGAYLSTSFTTMPNKFVSRTYERMVIKRARTTKPIALIDEEPLPTQAASRYCSWVWSP